MQGAKHKVKISTEGAGGARKRPCLAIGSIAPASAATPQRSSAKAQVRRVLDLLMLLTRLLQRLLTSRL